MRRTQDGVLDIDYLFLVFQILNELVMFVGIPYASRAILSKHIKHFPIKNAMLERKTKKPLALVSSRALSNKV